MLTELISAVVTIQLCSGGKKEQVPLSPLYQVVKLMELGSHHGSWVERLARLCIVTCAVCWSVLLHTHADCKSVQVNPWTVVRLEARIMPTIPRQ